MSSFDTSSKTWTSGSFSATGLSKVMKVAQCLALIACVTACSQSFAQNTFWTFDSNDVDPIQGTYFFNTLWRYGFNLDWVPGDPLIARVTNGQWNDHHTFPDINTTPDDISVRISYSDEIELDNSNRLHCWVTPSSPNPHSMFSPRLETGVGFTQSERLLENKPYQYSFEVTVTQDAPVEAWVIVHQLYQVTGSPPLGIFIVEHNGVQKFQACVQHGHALNGSCEASGWIGQFQPGVPYRFDIASTPSAASNGLVAVMVTKNPNTAPAIVGFFLHMGPTIYTTKQNGQPAVGIERSLLPLFGIYRSGIEARFDATFDKIEFKH